MLKLIVLLSISAVALGLPWFHLPSVKLPYFGGGRIVGGNDVDIEDYPYTLVLLSSGQFFCGAVLIDEEWALTAATCVSTASASSLSVRAGSTLQSSGGQVVSVSNVIVNPDYDSSTHDLDLALLQLSEAVTIETAAVAQLRPEPVEDGEPAEVAGWGTVESGGDTSETLQVAELSIVGREDCQNIYTANDVTENMICAGDSDGNRDACQGDAGGPLIVDGNVVGIVSWGYSTCGTAGYPGVYASIAAATPWIFETISGGSSPAPPSDLPSPQVTSPVLQVTSPVLQATSPVLQATSLVLQATSPVLQATYPVPQATYPVPQVTYPVLQVTSLALQVTCPVLQVTYPVLQVTYRVLQATYPVLQVTYPVLQVTSLALQVTYPVLQVTYRVLQATYPVLQVTSPAHQAICLAHRPSHQSRPTVKKK